MRLTRLFLRGAIGLHAISGLDEVEIDFTSVPEGLVALCGPNGAGKSTVLENLHPYPRLVSRPGALWRHFRLRDSRRVLEFQHGGHDYVCTIQIDPQAESVKGSFTKDGEQLCSGRIKDYEALVTREFGDPDIYFSDRFRSQNAQEIALLQPTEAKSLFTRILGLDRYAQYQDASKRIVKSLEPRVADATSKVKGLETALESLPEVDLAPVELTLSEATADFTLAQIAATSAASILSSERDRRDAWRENKNSISSGLEAERKIAQAILTKLEEEMAGLAEKSARELQGVRTPYDSETRSILQDIIDLRNNLEEVSKAKKELAALPEYDLQDLRVRLSAVRVDLEQTRRSAEEASEAHIRVETAGREKAAYDEKLFILNRDIEEALRLSGVCTTVPCQGTEMHSSCPLLSVANQYADKATRLQAEVAALTPPPESDPRDRELRRNLPALRLQLSGLTQTESDVMKLVAEAESQDRSGFLSVIGREEEYRTRLEQLEGRKVQVDASRMQAEADKRLEMKGERLLLEERISGQTEGIAKLDAELRALDSEAPVFRVEQYEAEHRLAVQKQADAERAIATLQERIKSLTAEKTRRDSLLEALKGAEEARDNLMLVLSRATTLQKALSPSGVLALELQSAGEGVTDHANYLLANTFGSEYRIQIDTVRIGSDGQVIETFAIRVLRNGEVDYRNLSGGQRVWIDAAIRKGIALFRHSAPFLTECWDEADGALDPDNAQQYLRMLQSAHNQAGLCHTIIITHRPEFQAQIPHRITIDHGVSVQ